MPRASIDCAIVETLLAEELVDRWIVEEIDQCGAQQRSDTLLRRLGADALAERRQQACLEGFDGRYFGRLTNRLI